MACPALVPSPPLLPFFPILHSCQRLQHHADKPCWNKQLIDKRLQKALLYFATWTCCNSAANICVLWTQNNKDLVQNAFLIIFNKYIVSYWTQTNRTAGVCGYVIWQVATYFWWRLCIYGISFMLPLLFAFSLGTNQEGTHLASTRG